jgi:hypothetical protein
MPCSTQLGRPRELAATQCPEHSAGSSGGQNAHSRYGEGMDPSPANAVYKGSAGNSHLCGARVLSGKASGCNGDGRCLATAWIEWRPLRRKSTQQSIVGTQDAM